MATRAKYEQQNSYFYDSVLSPAPGTSLWESFPALPFLCDPTIARVILEQFRPFVKATDGWVLTQATSGTAVAGTSPGKGVTLDAGATTDGQGPQIQLAGLSVIPAAGKHIWFETRLKVSDITGDFFFGLSETDTTIFAASDMTTSNHIGFSSFTGDGVLLADANKATARVHTLAVKTLVAATYVKLGFYVSGVDSITFWVDNVKNATTYTGTNIPIVGLTPSFGVHATGTQPVVDIDYLKVAQLR
jgi:hypothetical protein